MALLKYKDLEKMDKKQKEEKINELRYELTKSNVTANKSSAKTKEIKRSIARLFTSFKFNTPEKGLLKNKK